MKKIQWIALLSGVLVLGACSNYNSFNKRKFTKGKFRPGMARMKVQKASEEDKSDDVTLIASEELKADESQSISPPKKQEKTALDAQMIQPSVVEEVHRDELTSETFVEVESETTKATPIATEPKHSKTRGLRKNKKDLTPDERKARSALIYGIVGISVSALLVSALILIIATSSWVFVLYGLYRIPVLFALLGLYRGTMFYDNMDEMRDKYKKQRRRGISLAFLTLLIWVMLFL